MASELQILANRRNACKSSGPRTEQGKRRSRRNALRHGLTAETIIDGLEDPDEYRRFGAAIYAEFAPRTAFDETLVSRLVSLLWRLRRAAAIENGLLQIQCDILHERRMRGQAETPTDRLELIAKLLTGTPRTTENANNCPDGHTTNGVHKAPVADPLRLDRQRHFDLARCFLRLTNLDNGLFERLGRYETRLWRLVGQTVIAIEMRKTAEAPAASGPPIASR
jgi:hypothetical protein